MTDMPIKAIAPWFGGKRTLAPRIVEELGEHSAYFEPFCGGMSVLLNKPVSSHEDVNDLHGDLINLARVIQDERLGPRLYRRLRRVFVHEDAFKDSQEIIRNDECMAAPDLERAYHYYIHSWIGRNGVSGTPCHSTGYCRRWTPNGGHGGKRFASAVSSIPAWRRRMRSVTIQRMDGLVFLENIADCSGTSIYVDPPYLVKNAKYVHDPDRIPGKWGTLRWHVMLAKLLRRFINARVVVSYYDHPYIRRLYEHRGWTCIECTIAKSMVNSGMRAKGGRVDAPEVLLINGPSYTSQEAAPLLAAMEGE